jgi:triacylglycerol lipase
VALLVGGTIVAALAVHFASSPARLAATSIAPSRPGPVLLVPPYGGGTGALLILAKRLRANGRDARLVPVVGDGTGDLRAQAQQLKKTADEALAGGAESVDVVGYSAGGVVARIWAADLGGARQARSIVTLGSPHHGTRLASLARMLMPSVCPLGCQQLDPTSELMKSLPPAPTGPAWTAIWTNQDVVVTPPESAAIDGQLGIEVQQVCPDSVIGHSQLPTDPLVTGLVMAAVAPQPATAIPPASACAGLRARGAK